jgi:TolA-binding protein
MRRLVCSAAAVVAVCLLLAPAGALAGQASTASLTETDLQRLRTAVSDTRAEIDRAKLRDPQLVSTLTQQLNDLSDEVTYLSVRLRKEHQVPRSEYLDLRDRIDDVRAKAQGDRPARVPAPPRMAVSGEIPVGTEIDVRLLDPLSSGRNQVEDRFRATTVVDLQTGERVIIPAGSEMRGVVSAAEKAGRIDRKGSLQLAFDQITVNGRQYRLHGTVTQALEGEGLKGEAGKLGTGAAVGGIIGGILGGLKGSIAGVLIGGGGVAAATPGTDAELAQGTILRVRLDQPPIID